MATIPTPEESGTKILQIYKNRNIRFREILTFQVINGDWMKMGERKSRKFTTQGQNGL